MTHSSTELSQWLVPFSSRPLIGKKQFMNIFLYFQVFSKQMFRIFNIKSLKDIQSAYIILHVQGHSHSTDTCTFFASRSLLQAMESLGFKKLHTKQLYLYSMYQLTRTLVVMYILFFFFSITNTDVSFAPNERLAHFYSYTFMCTTHNHIQCLNRQKCLGRGYDVQEWTMSTG